MLNVLLLILGFVLLIKGADIFVDSSVNIARKLKIPSIIIGLTIVAMGTSLPEAVVSVTASLRGSNAIALGNVVGSNIFNLLFIIGACALVKPFAVKFKEIYKDFMISIFAAVTLLVMMILFKDYIPQLGGVVMLAAFAVYIGWLIKKSLSDKNAGEEEVSSTVIQKPIILSIFFAILGCSMIIIGGQFTVNSAVEIARTLGVSERIIGLTIIAVGTSLPEFVTSIVACKKNNNDIALGNVVGSNIFNILFVLGTAGAITPLAIDTNLIFDTIILTVGSLVTLCFIYTGKKVVRFEGAAMIMGYAAYITFICIK